MHEIKTKEHKFHYFLARQRPFGHDRRMVSGSGSPPIEGNFVARPGNGAGSSEKPRKASIKGDIH